MTSNPRSWRRRYDRLKPREFFNAGGRISLQLFVLMGVEPQ